MIIKKILINELLWRCGHGQWTDDGLFFPLPVIRTWWKLQLRERNHTIRSFSGGAQPMPNHCGWAWGKGNKYSNVFLHPPSNFLAIPWIQLNWKSEDDRAWVMHSTEVCTLAFRTWQRSKRQDNLELNSVNISYFFKISLISSLIKYHQWHSFLRQYGANIWAWLKHHLSSEERIKILSNPLVWETLILTISPDILLEK